MRVLRGLARLGHDVLGHVPRSAILQHQNPLVQTELVHLIRASSNNYEGAMWWLEDQDTLTLVRQAIFTGAREEALRIWCLWLDHGLGLDEDIDCFLPELSRLLPAAPPRQQCVFLRFLAKVNMRTAQTTEIIHKWLVHPSHSTCITSGAPFVLETIASLVETPWTFRILRRLRECVEDCWPPTQWPVHGSFKASSIPTLADDCWGIFPGAPMAPFVPDDLLVPLLCMEELPCRELPFAAPLWEVGLRQGMEGLQSTRDGREARRRALDLGIDLPLELWLPCEDSCSAVLAPFLAVKEAPKEVVRALLDQIPKLEAPNSVTFLALCVIMERFSDDDSLLDLIDPLLMHPSMPMGGLPFPSAFSKRLVDLFEALMRRLTDDCVRHPTLVRLLACFAAQWSPLEVRRKFWVSDPHFPTLLCQFWGESSLVGSPETYTEMDPEMLSHLEPYRVHPCAKKMPLAAFLI